MGGWHCSELIGKEKLFKKSKTHSKLINKQAQHPVLSYLPDGWEFAIVPVKPPKGYKNTENKMVRRGSAGPEHPRAAGESWVPEECMALGDEEQRWQIRQQNHTLCPSLNLPGLTWDKAGTQDHLRKAPPTNTGFRNQCQKISKKTPCGRMNFSKSQISSPNKTPLKEKKPSPTDAWFSIQETSQDKREPGSLPRTVVRQNKTVLSHRGGQVLCLQHCKRDSGWVNSERPAPAAMGRRCAPRKADPPSRPDKHGTVPFFPGDSMTGQPPNLSS